MKSRFTLCAALTVSFSLSYASEPATVEIVNTTKERISFQPEDFLSYNHIEAADTVLTIDNTPAYYRFITENGTFYPVFISPGSSTHIEVGKEEVKISGTNEDFNHFIRENVYICHTPETIKTYSDEWVDYNEKEIQRLDSLIDGAGISSELAATHKLYNRFTFLNQRLGGLYLAKAFQPEGEKVEAGEKIYSFLDTLKFTDDRILTIPRWFTVMNNALEMMEKRGQLPVDNDNYMSIYAKTISNGKVRSHFLTNLLDLTLHRNYLNDFERQLPAVREMITDNSAQTKLTALLEQYAEKKRIAGKVCTGTEMPDMMFRDINGKEYRLSDFKGNYILLDFWFTGCAPCRAEMPYFDKVAKEFDGHGIKFISLSVDTGDQLYAAWQRTLKKKGEIPEVLSVNLPDGFKSPVMKQLNITGVPRIMLIGPDGKIVESYAKRPSDPKLRGQLLSLTR